MDMAKILENVILSGGYSRSNQFEVKISSPIDVYYTNSKLDRIAMNCSDSPIPGKVFETNDSVQGGKLLKKSPHSIQFQDLKLTFLLSEDHLELEYINQWMGLISDDFGFQRLKYYDDYATGTITINQLSRKGGGGVVSSYRFQECYPIGFQNIDLSSSSRDSVNNLIVDFAFRYWEKLI